MNKSIFLIILILIISPLYGYFIIEKQDKKVRVTKGPPEPLHTFDLPRFKITTLDAELHYVTITISLGYKKTKALEDELKKNYSHMQFMINIHLMQKKYKDLNSIKGVVLLAEEIKVLINKFLIKGKIKEVYIKEFIVD